LRLERGNDVITWARWFKRVFLSHWNRVTDEMRTWNWNDDWC
jgi:hypothetical protein